MATRWWDRIRALFDSERGATMVEYGLMVALVALVVAVGAATFGTGLLGLFNDAADCVDALPGTC